MSAAELPGCARLELAEGVVPLNPQEAVFEAMLAGWARQQRSRFLREDATIGPRAALVRRLAGFAGQYPWEWEPAEAEAFITHLRSGARPVAASTDTRINRVEAGHASNSRVGVRNEGCAGRCGFR